MRQKPTMRPKDANGDPVFSKEELAKIYKAELDDVMPDWPFSKKELDDINAEMGDGCLHMIGELLNSTECKCGPGEHGKGTPAMNYPEWIVCCLRKALEKQRERDAAMAAAFIRGMGLEKAQADFNAKAIEIAVAVHSLHPDYIPKPKEPVCP